MRTLTWLLFAAASLMAVAEVTLSNNATVDSIDLAGHHDIAQQRLVRRALKEGKTIFGRFEIRKFFQKTDRNCMEKVTVVSALDRRTQQMVVLKLTKEKSSLLRGLFGNYCGRRFQWTKREEHKELKELRIHRMTNEIEKAKLLSGFKHSLPMLDSFTKDGYIVAVFPLMNRGDLHHLMDNFKEGQVFVTLTLPSRDDQGNVLTPRKVQRHVFPEDVAKMIIIKVLKGIKEFHDNGLIHMDLKPENIYANVGETDLDIRIADFDTVHRFVPGQPLKLEGAYGTAGYASPEMIRFHANPNVAAYGTFEHPTSLDMFSIGRLFQRMLFGLSDEVSLFDQFHQPLHMEELAQIYEKVPEVSREAIELIRFLTHPKPSIRPSVNSVLQHHYLAESKSFAQNVPIPVERKESSSTPPVNPIFPSSRPYVKPERPLAKVHRLNKLSADAVMAQRARKFSTGAAMDAINAGQGPVQSAKPAAPLQEAPATPPHPFRRSRSSDDLLAVNDQTSKRKDSLLQFHATANRLSNSNKNINEEIQSNPKVALLRERFEELIRLNEPSRGVKPQLPIRVGPKVPILA